MNLVVSHSSRAPFVPVAFASLAAALVLAFAGSAMADPQVKAVGAGCIYNSDCMSGLVCHASGRCIAECQQDRDCAAGYTCKWPGAMMGTLRITHCAPPPATGQLAGMVERAPGQGSACEIHVAGRIVRCDAQTGEFLVDNVAAGAYKLRVKVDRGTRDLSVYVNAAATTYLGSIPTASLRMPLVVIPLLPSRPAVPMLRR